MREFESIPRRQYEGPYGRRVSTGLEGVVALTRFRGLQFNSLFLRQGESLLQVIIEGKEGDPEVLGPSVIDISGSIKHRICRGDKKVPR